MSLGKLCLCLCLIIKQATQEGDFLRPQLLFIHFSDVNTRVKYS